MAKQDFTNKDFEYFNVEVDPGSGKQVIDLRDDTVAIWEGDRVKINQLDPLAKSSFDYDSVTIPIHILLDLAEYIKNN